MKSEFKNRQGNTTFKEFSKEKSAEWNELSPAQKEIYQTRAQESTLQDNFQNMTAAEKEKQFIQRRDLISQLMKVFYFVPYLLLFFTQS